jgi:hypothetical protein
VYEGVILFARTKITSIKKKKKLLGNDKENCKLSLVSMI